MTDSRVDPDLQISLWRGDRALGEVYLRRPLNAGELHGVLIPADDAPPLESLWQVRFDWPDGTVHVFQHLLPLDARPGPVALQPLSEEEARGVPPERLLVLRGGAVAMRRVRQLTLEECRPDPTDPEVVGWPRRALRHGSAWVVSAFFGAAPEPDAAGTGDPRRRRAGPAAVGAEGGQVLGALGTLARAGEVTGPSRQERGLIVALLTRLAAELHVPAAERPAPAREAMDVRGPHAPGPGAARVNAEEVLVALTTLARAGGATGPQSPQRDRIIVLLKRLSLELRVPWTPPGPDPRPSPESPSG